MSNHLKFCSCRMCRAGRHSVGGKTTIKRVVRSNRRKVKTALRSKAPDADEKIPTAVSVPYTD